MIVSLSESQLIAINVYLIQRYSPDELIGVKDSGSLHMCVNSVYATAFGEEVYPSIIEKAAILFINLVKKHCFHNANKRTAFVALEAFLTLNSKELSLTTDEAISLCVNVATWDESFDALKDMVIKEISEKLT
ncbi:death on curing protein [Trichococcus flocculiformis]|uniref:type II toxin-antitoxin system death-on-curing family toxin n=1 Tax=Trichococcus TaxID=82802 RepID=UPI0007A82536|nr:MULTISPECIES: type II toxin-antitoxin system death-on-curing family toxin [Trichococcus]CZQ86714.1 death on curing protein [Trichococcus sp. ES5]SHF27183.1 death on curing protein [Trichococcus flocculiformis]